MNYLFEQLTEAEYKKISKNIVLDTKTYKKGDTVHKEGELCTAIGYVRKGTLTCKNIYDNNEPIIKVITSTKTFGEALIFMDDSRYKGTFTAVKDSTVDYLSKEILLTLIKKEPKISLALLKQISEEYVETNDHKKILFSKTVRRKFLRFLLIQSTNINKLTFPINFSKTELAIYLNVERPTLSKEIHLLQNEGIIRNDRKVYEILDLKYIQNNV